MGTIAGRSFNYCYNDGQSCPKELHFHICSSVALIGWYDLRPIQKCLLSKNLLHIQINKHKANGYKKQEKNKKTTGFLL